MKIGRNPENNMFHAKFSLDGKKYIVEGETKKDVFGKIRKIRGSVRTANAPGTATNADDITGMVEIYSDILEIHAKKGNGSIYAGQEFVHEFERAGSKIFGLPDKTRIVLPDGDEYILSSRSLLIVNKKTVHLWDNFEQ